MDLNFGESFSVLNNKNRFIIFKIKLKLTKIINKYLIKNKYIINIFNIFQIQMIQKLIIILIKMYIYKTSKFYIKIIKTQTKYKQKKIM